MKPVVPCQRLVNIPFVFNSRWRDWSGFGTAAVEGNTGRQIYGLGK